uniref:uncharacterized protein LOC132669982 isoform X2 n=1 Tax=Panthera onca TaxID=9690 RepID=UPI002953277E|nr:uncharacterized protein LOC132669982 isoform X2 [Panthera onca]
MLIHVSWFYLSHINFVLNKNCTNYNYTLHTLLRRGGDTVIQACFDPPVKTVPTKNPMMYKKRAADPVCPDLTALLVKNKTLLAEVYGLSENKVPKENVSSVKLRNLQNKLFIKETSLQEMKSELESYKRNNVHQSSQIMSLKEDIKDLEELIASLTRIKSLKNTNIQNLERGNWDLTEKIIELENNLR